MTNPEPRDEGVTAPVELPPLEASPPPAAAPLTPTPVPLVDGAVPVPLDGARGDVMYVPLAVTIGDGFKFGCGFFMALVLAMLIGFVLIAALFALTTVIGVNLPLSR